MRACGRGRLQGLDPATGSFCPSESRRTRRVDAFLGFFPSERSLPPALASALGRGGSPRTRSAGRRHRSACVTGFQSSEGSVGPSRGYRLSWAFSPSDRRGTAATRAESGLMASPHGSRALQAARTDPCSLDIESGRGFRLGPAPPSIGARISLSMSNQSELVTLSFFKEMLYY
jgi:hypothetical protein